MVGSHLYNHIVSDPKVNPLYSRADILGQGGKFQPVHLIVLESDILQI